MILVYINCLEAEITAYGEYHHGMLGFVARLLSRSWQ